MPASAQDGAYPRPQLVRSGWRDLSGTWGFAFDDDDAGLDRGWQNDPEAFTAKIVVPFPPESRASGIGDTGFHRVLWYRRTVTAAETKNDRPSSPYTSRLSAFSTIFCEGQRAMTLPPRNVLR